MWSYHSQCDCVAEERHRVTLWIKKLLALKTQKSVLQKKWEGLVVWLVRLHSLPQRGEECLRQAAVGDDEIW